MEVMRLRGAVLRRRREARVVRTKRQQRDGKPCCAVTLSPRTGGILLAPHKVILSDDGIQDNSNLLVLPRNLIRTVRWGVFARVHAVLRASVVIVLHEKFG
eukprot:scaffold2657_cov89-Amphora_coffeaeformis.AAC.10